MDKELVGAVYLGRSAAFDLILSAALDRAGYIRYELWLWLYLSMVFWIPHYCDQS